MNKVVDFVFDKVKEEFDDSELEEDILRTRLESSVGRLLIELATQS